MKVYIIPVGWEKDIILKTIYKVGADRVYLISSKVKKGTALEAIDNKTNKSLEEIKRTLSKFTEVIPIKTSYVDYLGAFNDVRKIIKKELEEGNEIFINIAGGNKLIAAVLLSAAFLHGLKAYYTIPKNYVLVEGSKESFRKGILKIIEIPPLPINIDLSKKEKELLKMIEVKQQYSVRDYVKIFPYSDQNRARAQFNYYVKKLCNCGLASTKTENGRRKIFLTKSGKLILKIIE